MKSMLDMVYGAARSVPVPAKIPASLITVLLLSLTGCTSGDVDFWGNPTSRPTCTVTPATRAPSPIDQNFQMPPGTPSGYSWITYRLAVEAVGPPPDSDNTYCLPVDIEYTKSVADPDLLIENQNGMPETVMPVTNTPWIEFVSFNYDPRLERFQGNPPTYRIDLKATFVDFLRDHPDVSSAQAFRCSIALNGATIAQDLKIVPAGNVCAVTITNNLFRPYGA